MQQRPCRNSTPTFRPRADPRRRAGLAIARRVLALGCLLACLACNRSKSPSEPSARAACGSYPAQETSPYVLPYAVGSSHSVVQGNCGSFSHQAGSVNQFGYDFSMPLGREAVAARAGKVVVAIGDRPEHTNQYGDENVVVIDHGDGTFARYLHFKTGGTLVAVGDIVSPGDPVGLIGLSGFTAGPHLHFDVAQGCYQYDVDCPTIPTTFRNTTPHPNGLVQGRAYRADSY